MGFRISNLFSPPTFEDADKARIARLVNLIAWTLTGISFVGMLTAPLSDPGRPEAVIASGIFAIIALITQIFLRRGSLNAAGVVLVAASWIWNTLALLILGGITHPFTSIYFIIILSAALIFSARAAVVITAATILAGLGLMAGENLGLLIPPATPTFARWITFSLLISFAALLLSIAVQNLNRALSEARRSQRELLNSNRELNKTRSELEGRIAERTASLQEQNSYLEATTDVSRAASTILEIDTLVSDVSEMIRARFELYYVGLFLVDENGEWAVLRGGTGVAGRAMLARGHRIRVGEGMVGWSIANAQPRVALQAEQDDVRLRTPELPETRSEAALPLRSRGQVIGALSVQSVYAGVFTPEVISVLQTLADQIAIAIDNARLFSESQNTLEAVRRAYGDISREAWNELSATRKDWGYAFSGTKLQPIKGSWTAEMHTAMRTGKPQIQQESGQNGASPGQLLIVPIKVRGQAIGVLNLRRSPSTGEWTQVDIDALETIADRLSSALESARLYRDSQDRAVRESMISDISARMRSTLNVDSILKTAVREMRAALNLQEVELRMGDAARNTFPIEDTIPTPDPEIAEDTS
jgi:GAF domain-containing protein